MPKNDNIENHHKNRPNKSDGGLENKHIPTMLTSGKKPELENKSDHTLIATKNTLCLVRIEPINSEPDLFRDL